MKAPTAIKPKRDTLTYKKVKGTQTKATSPQDWQKLEREMTPKFGRGGRVWESPRRRQTTGLAAQVLSGATVGSEAPWPAFQQLHV